MADRRRDDARQVAPTTSGATIAEDARTAVAETVKDESRDQGRAPSGQLRVYLRLDKLQKQFAAYLGTPTRARGFPPLAGQTSLIVEIAPGLQIERVTDLALKAVPSVEPGILFVERQFGILEIHADASEDVEAAGRAILEGMGARAEDQVQPKILYDDVIEDVTDLHAVIINRNRQASMLLPGQTLLVVEMTPALYAAAAANEAEAASPDVTLVDVQMIGAAGRVYIAGTTEQVTVARTAILDVLAAAGADR